MFWLFQKLQYKVRKKRTELEWQLASEIAVDLDSLDLQQQTQKTVPSQPPLTLYGERLYTLYEAKCYASRRSIYRYHQQGKIRLIHSSEIPGFNGKKAPCGRDRVYVRGKDLLKVKEWVGKNRCRGDDQLAYRLGIREAILNGIRFVNSHEKGLHRKRLKGFIAYHFPLLEGRKPMSKADFVYWFKRVKKALRRRLLKKVLIPQKL